MNRDKNTEKDLALIKSTFESNNDLSYKIFEQMPIGICVTNPQGLFTDVNASYCDLYGYTRDELIGNSFTMVVPDDYKNQLEGLHEQFIEKKFELAGRWTVMDKSSNLFEIIANAAFLYDRTGTEIRKMTLVVKADEMENTIARLRTTVEILEQKISTQDIANKLAEHDMRNRLSSIVSIADILYKSELNDRQKQWVSLLKDIGLDTLKLLHSSKDFAKMERGVYQLDVTEFDLIALIANQTSEYLDLILQKKIVISLTDDLDNELEPEEDTILAKGDAFYLGHLFQNLIKNAIEAAPVSSLIEIKITRLDRYMISINNEGEIPADIKANFFDKYTSSGKEIGTGLGTYIAKLITDTHNGHISFISNKIVGTTIIVELPIIEQLS